MEKVNEKKVLVLSFIAVIVLILVVVGATYAYFTATSSGDGNINTNISSNTTDNLSFNIGNAININATEENFGEGMPSLSGSTQASATLTANNYTNNATRNYYVYLNITNNNFVYTTDTNETELFLSITDPLGNPVTSIAGLTSVTIDGVQGFDITTKTGLITIANNYEITTTSTTIQEWNIIVTFVNLDSDQQENTEKSFNATLIMQENAPISISNVTTSNISTDSITLNVDATSENSITNYYYAIGDGEFVESTSNTYTFDNLDADSEYTFRVYAVDDAGYQSAIYNINVATEPIRLFADYIKNTVYTGDGNEGIYYHDGQGTYGSLEARDNSYRYAGANPDNYVCFGSDAEVCSNDNLYRIIGVFGENIKLIKEMSYGTYAWDTSGMYGVNNWQTSTLKSTLNSVYLSSLGTWNNLIETNTTWYLGGWSTTGATSRQFYEYERGTSVISGRPTSDTGAIGLMYPSDYGYAASPSEWTVSLSSYNNSTTVSNNWLYLGSTEWTIMPYSSNSIRSFCVFNGGYLYIHDVYNVFDVRPVFYLKNNVVIVSGDGTSTNPYRLS